MIHYYIQKLPDKQLVILEQLALGGHTIRRSIVNFKINMVFQQMKVGTSLCKFDWIIHFSYCLYDSKSSSRQNWNSRSNKRKCDF